MPASLDPAAATELSVLVVTPAFSVATAARRRLGALPGVHVDVLMPDDGGDVAAAARTHAAVILCPYVPAAVHAVVRSVAGAAGTRPRVLEMAEGPDAHALVVRAGAGDRVSARERQALARLAAALDLPLEVESPEWDPAGRPV